MKNSTNIKRLASKLAQGSAQLNHDIALMSKYDGDLNPDSLVKYEGSMQEALSGLSNTLADIEFFIAQTEELAHDKKPPVIVPDFIGKTIEQAQVLIDSAQLENTRVIEKEKEESTGEVYRQYPPAGESIARSDEVQLFVYIGV